MSSRDFTQRGTVIRYNVFHHVGGFGKSNSWNPVRNGQVEFHYPGFTWGIYLDAPEVGCTVFGNVLYSVPVCGLFNHEGRDNRWENNIIIDAPAFRASSGNYPDLDKLSYSYIQALRDKGGYDTYLQHYPELATYTDDPATHHTCAPGTFARNIIYYTRRRRADDAPAEQGQLGRAGNSSGRSAGARRLSTGFEFDNNCVYGPPELPLKFSLTLRPDAARLLDWDQWRQQGKDGHSLLADPKFVDPAKHDYRLQPDSPALKLGFQPIPFEKIGPYEDPLRASWPIVEAPGAAALGEFTTQRFFKLPGREPVPAVELQPRRGPGQRRGQAQGRPGRDRGGLRWRQPCPGPMDGGGRPVAAGQVPGRQADDHQLADSRRLSRFRGERLSSGARRAEPPSGPADRRLRRRRLREQRGSRASQCRGDGAAGLESEPEHGRAVRLRFPSGIRGRLRQGTLSQRRQRLRTRGGALRRPRDQHGAAPGRRWHATAS